MSAGLVNAPRLSDVETADPEVVVVEDLDRPWVVIVWNDPINLMHYVTLVIQTVFGYDKPKAEKMMMDVHEKGRSTVFSGPRSESELKVFQLHEYGLWATMQQD